MTCADCLESLGPFIDGELPAEEARLLNDHLRTCADCAAAHRRLLETSSRVKSALMRFEAPDVLKARIRASLADPSRTAEGHRLVPLSRGRTWPRMVAVAATVAIVSSGLTFSAVRQRASANSVEQEVLASHIRSLMPGHLTDVASNDQHNVKPWFNGRVNMSPDVPRLDSIGYPLIGGRIDYIDGRNVAVVVYMRRQHVINVFSWPAPRAGDLTAASFSANGYHGIHGRRHGEERWIISDLNLAELENFARSLTAAP